MATFVLDHFWPRLMAGAKTMELNKNNGHLFVASINQLMGIPKVFVLLFFKGATLIGPSMINNFS